MKYVRETAAGKSLSAWVILKGAREVATVQAHYSNGGAVTVNIWQGSEAAERSVKAAKRDGVKIKPDKYDPPMAFQHATAGGYGYDKLTAALAGLYVDGIELTDHCSRKGAPKPPKGRTTFPHDYQPPKGYSVSNWVKAKDDRTVAAEAGMARHEYGSPEYRAAEAEFIRASREGESAGYADCYRAHGLKFLEKRGYRVISAI